MEAIRTAEEMRGYLKQHSGKSIGLVATMGSLHEGHASLIRTCASENDITIVSIFINPKQFAANEDLSSYPRDESGDLLTCRQNGCDVAFLPSGTEVYPDGYDTHVETGVGGALRNACSEGASRPTFFRGVATVVTKLHTLIQPSRTYFGQKDAQQVAVVATLLRDLWMDCSLRVCATVRDADQVALSSRNAYLTPAQRLSAAALIRGLRSGEASFRHGANAEAVRDAVRGAIERAWANDPDGRLLYVSVCHRWSLREVHGAVPSDTLLCAAAMLGNTRLVDNLLLHR